MKSKQNIVNCFMVSKGTEPIAVHCSVKVCDYAGMGIVWKVRSGVTIDNTPWQSKPTRQNIRSTFLQVTSRKAGSAAFVREIAIDAWENDKERKGLT